MRSLMSANDPKQTLAWRDLGKKKPELGLDSDPPMERRERRDESRQMT